MDGEGMKLWLEKVWSESPGGRLKKPSLLVCDQFKAHVTELYKELKNNNNATFASYYRDYAEILSRVLSEAKITKNDQLILNSHNKVKTTWAIINKESGNK